MNKKSKKISATGQLRKKLGLAHKRHTGKRLKAHHTSYGVLFLLLLLFAPNFIITRGINGIITRSGNVVVTATVLGSAPTVPAVITSPTGGTVSTQNITISGTCGPNLLVKIFRNDVFAGSTFCNSTGNFSISITLYTGRNDLRALNYDNLDQPGPTSATVTVTYTPPTNIITKSPLKAINLLLTADYHLRQINPDTIATWEFAISFGSAPYNVKTNWGDNNAEVATLPKNGTFYLHHTYNQSGKYLIAVTVTDANQATTAVQLAVTVNGPEAITTASTDKTEATDCSTTIGNWFVKLSCRLKNIGLVNIWVPLYWLLLTIIGFLWLLHRLQEKVPNAKTKPAR